MCLSQYLLVLASTLPIGMAMGGPRGPDEQSDSLMNPSVPRQHSQGINELARRARHGSQGLLALSTLAAALVLSFLIFRCFIALHPRVNNKDSRVNLRRLAYYIPDVCSVRIQKPASCQSRCRVLFLFSGGFRKGSKVFGKDNSSKDLIGSP